MMIPIYGCQDYGSDSFFVPFLWQVSQLNSGWGQVLSSTYEQALVDLDRLTLAW